MSYYIKIQGWTGQNADFAATRFAKVFRFSPAQATGIMQGIQKGQLWQFDKTISPAQSEKARAYLQSLGYNVELIPFVPQPNSVATKKATSEILAPPMERLPRKSPLDFLKKFKLGGLSGGEKKSPPSRNADLESAKTPKKSFLDFLKPKKPVPPLERSKPVPETQDVEIAPQPKKSFLDFLKPKKPVPPPERPMTVPEAPEVEVAPLPKKSFFDFLKPKKTGPAPEVKKAVPQGYRQKSKIGLIAFVFVLIAATSVLPYYFGMRAEAILNELMPRMFQKGVVFKLKSYDRGWLRSSAEYTISAPKGAVFQGTSEIEHGPFFLEEVLAGNFNYFQARIESKIPVIIPKAPEGSQASDPLESLVMKGYFVKKGKMYKIDLLILDEGLNVNGKLIPSAQK